MQGCAVEEIQRTLCIRKTLAVSSDKKWSFDLDKVEL